MLNNLHTIQFYSVVQEAVTSVASQYRWKTWWFGTACVPIALDRKCRTQSTSFPPTIRCTERRRKFLDHARE